MNNNIINKFQEFNAELDTPYLYAAGIIRSAVGVIDNEVEQEFFIAAKELMDENGIVTIANPNILDKYYYSREKIQKLAVLIDELLREVIPEEEFIKFRKFVENTNKGD